MSLKLSLEGELSESLEDHISEELVSTPRESNIIPLELSQEARRWVEAIGKLREPCDRQTRKLRIECSQKLNGQMTDISK